MNYKKVAGLGILEWFILFLLIVVTISLYSAHASVPLIIGIIAGILSYVLAGHLRISSIRIALLSSTIWLIIFLVLDLFITDKINTTLFTSWGIWFEYILLFLGPLLRVHRHSHMQEEHLSY